MADEGVETVQMMACSAPMARMAGGIQKRSARMIADPEKPIEIRKKFPETWIFDSFDFNES